LSRFYENLEAGCIPVIIDKFKDFDYSRQFKAWKEQLMEVEWRKGNSLPFIWVNTTAQFMEIYDSFFLEKGGLAKLDVMQRDTIEWWKEAKSHFKKLHEDAFCLL
jgi:hypothetical protein